MESQSGASRFMNSLVVALCVAPILVIVGCFLLGWNEKRAVCDQRALDEALEKVKEVPCTAPAEDGHLVLFSCDVSDKGLASFELPGVFAEKNKAIKGTGVQVKALMKQCVESQDTKKDKGGGGGTTTTFSYTVEWSDHFVDDSKFHKDLLWKQACGVPNSWPDNFPTSKTFYADSAIVGPYTVSKPFVQKIPLTAPVKASAPNGWSETKTTTSGGGSFMEYSLEAVKTKNNPNRIGDYKVSFWTSDKSHPTMTVLGLNKNGQVTPWVSGKSWLCSGGTVYDLMYGKESKDDVFSVKMDEASAMTVILRILGFLLIWFACSRFMEPLGVLADCIPCIGPWLGDQIEAIACCISCFPACACSLGVIGVVYVAMRPLIGIPMLLIFVGTMAAGVLFKMNSSKNAEARQPDGYYGQEMAVN
eukprot:CAMPEP_0206447512 /NCGR_PEP_ID=MMETSP0324_2-20121206/16854_1 /ASSEMBLY_ACC=CAM_ASM_000836 /TAXON_ID=2866 /ORGANISM="Crypthecodinium cohnii, Strain Seligo" /LENGTH=417 /DNA_ID=CAMNT_0053916345 /DNA_START=129 /DNA_END=1382 /DNA_ORIENTATION=-